MSLYTMVHGENPQASRLIEILGLTKEKFGRYRDAFVNYDGSKILVYTRCGGNNRESYSEIINHLRCHTQYENDYDDDFDETYCYFVFEVPEADLEETRAMSTGKDPLSVHEMFEQQIKEMEDPNSEARKKAVSIMEKIEKGIKDNPNGGIIKI